MHKYIFCFGHIIMPMHYRGCQLIFQLVCLSHMGSQLKNENSYEVHYLHGCTSAVLTTVKQTPSETKDKHQLFSIVALGIAHQQYFLCQEQASYRVAPIWKTQ